MSSISRLELLYQLNYIYQQIYIASKNIRHNAESSSFIFLIQIQAWLQWQLNQETNLRCKMMFFKHLPYLFQYFTLNCKKGSLKMRTALTMPTDRLLSVQKHGFTYFVTTAKMTLNIDFLHWFGLKVKKKYSIIAHINFLNVCLVREKWVIKRAKIYR